MIVPLLALDAFGRADTPPAAASDRPLGSQKAIEAMSRIIGSASYPVLQGVGSVSVAQQGLLALVIT